MSNDYLGARSFEIYFMCFSWTFWRTLISIDFKMFCTKTFINFHKFFAICFAQKTLDYPIRNHCRRLNAPMSRKFPSEQDSVSIPYSCRVALCLSLSSPTVTRTDCAFLADCHILQSFFWSSKSTRADYFSTTLKQHNLVGSTPSGC